MLDKKKLAREIIDAWNRHDLESFVSYHSEDLAWSSPAIQRLTGKEVKTLTGMAPIKELWGKALEKYPQIKSIIIDIFEGVDSVAVYYASAIKDRPVVDVMYFNEAGKVWKLDVFYG